MEKKYRFLRIGSVIFKVLAWVSLALGVVACVVILIGGGTPGAPRVTGLVGLLLGGIYFFLFCIASAVIRILLDIEGNTKKSSTTI